MLGLAALSAWETNRSEPLTALTWTSDVPLVTVMDPAIPGLMAREWPVASLPGALWPRGRLPGAHTIPVARLASCRAYQPGCDGGRRRPKTKYEIGTTPAELTIATTGARSHFGPRIWSAGRRLMSMRAAPFRMLSRQLP